MELEQFWPIADSTRENIVCLNQHRTCLSDCVLAMSLLFGCDSNKLTAIDCRIIYFPIQIELRKYSLISTTGNLLTPFDPIGVSNNFPD
jgi:hypothetical protein